MSKQLKQFLSEYVAWVDAGADTHPVFRRDSGLCALSAKWYRVHVLGLSVVTAVPYDEDTGRWADEVLSIKLAVMFADAGLDPVFPFNRFGGKLVDAPSYHDEAYEDACHTNQARLAWVRAQLEAE